MQALTNTTQRLLTYRWYPTALQTADGRLLIVSGEDVDEGTGCGFCCSVLKPGCCCTPR